MRLRFANLWVVGAFTIAILVALCVSYVRSRPLVFGMEVHMHCIKLAGLALHQYATAHGGKFPHSPKGYPDALLQLDPVSFDPGVYNALTGPGYSPEPLLRAKRDGTPLNEEDCGRVYIQGLRLYPQGQGWTTGSNHQIVILFDKLPTPGGDHCGLPRRMWAEPGREVCYRDGSMNFIPESQWPEFARQQVEFLVEEGFDRAEAERLYAPAPKSSS
jgi:hypothetical protein